MPGPAPKDRSGRRRANSPALGEWVDLPPLDEPVLPELPNGRDWSSEARAMWGSWREDPATAMWSPADRGYALDTIRLVDLFAGNPRTTFAAEVRLRLDGLGLTPRGRRNLRWRIVGPAEAVEHPVVSTRTPERRRRLRAVESSDKGRLV